MLKLELEVYCESVVFQSEDLTKAMKLNLPLNFLPGREMLIKTWDEYSEHINRNTHRVQSTLLYS